MVKSGTQDTRHKTHDDQATGRPGGQKRILIVGVDWLGDVIFSTPVIRALRKKYPDAFIAYSTAPRCAGALKENPRLDRVIAFDEGTLFGGMGRAGRFLSELRALRFDTAVFLHRSATRVFLAAAAGIKRRIGYSRTKTDWLLTDRVPRPIGRRHRIDRYLEVLKPLGSAPNGREVEWFVADDERRRAGELLKGTPLEGRPYAVIHPGGNWDLKRWPAARFARVARHLADKGIASAVCGGAHESALAAEVAAAAPGHAVALAGRTDLRTLAALIEKGQVMISNDSGPLHIAAALRVPHVGVFGPTSIADTGPVSKAPSRLVQRKVGCELPCYFGSCHHRLCMEGLQPEAVIRAVDELLVISFKL